MHDLPEYEKEPDNAIDDSSDSESEKTGQDEMSLMERLQRLQAEFQNYRKRVEKENMELSSFIKSQLIYKLLPVIDDFSRMFNHGDEEDLKIINGSEAIYRKLLSILQDEGLETIQTVGRTFDPYLHEAVLVESGAEGEDDQIIEEWEKGYMFKSKLLRPAKVKVYKKVKS